VRILIRDSREESRDGLGTDTITKPISRIHGRDVEWIGGPTARRQPRDRRLDRDDAGRVDFISW
jgi:hypothetical protein